jgi:hypothetical protein
MSAPEVSPGSGVDPDALDVNRKVRLAVQATARTTVAAHLVWVRRPNGAAGDVLRTK